MLSCQLRLTRLCVCSKVGSGMKMVRQSRCVWQASLGTIGVIMVETWTKGVTVLSLDTKVWNNHKKSIPLDWWVGSRAPPFHKKLVYVVFPFHTGSGFFHSIQVQSRGIKILGVSENWGPPKSPLESHLRATCASDNQLVSPQAWPQWPPSDVCFINPINTDIDRFK